MEKNNDIKFLNRKDPNEKEDFIGVLIIGKSTRIPQNPSETY